MKLRLTLCLFVFGLAALAPGAARAATATYAFDGNLARGKTLTVSNVNGNVNVRAGEAFRVRATLKALRSDPHAVRIITEPTGEGYAVCVRYPGDARDHCAGSREHLDSDNNDTTVDFEITVPRGTSVDAKSVNGNVGVHDAVRASGISVNGKVTIEADDVSDAKTVNGNITLRLSDAASRRELDLMSVNGAIALTLPKSTGLSVEAHVLNGAIEVDPSLAVHRPQFGPGESVSGKLGDGSRQLYLKTLNGNITVTRV